MKAKHHFICFRSFRINNGNTLWSTSSTPKFSEDEEGEGGSMRRQDNDAKDMDTKYLKEIFTADKK